MRTSSPAADPEHDEAPAVVETPAPVDETPVVETPAPVDETPVVESPVVETPVVESPVVESPVVESPVVEEPVEAPPSARPAAARFRTTPEPESEAEAETSPVEPDAAAPAAPAAPAGVAAFGADPADAPELTIALETPTAGLAAAEVAPGEVAIVPPSRREKALARREAQEQARAEKAALRESRRGTEARRGLAEKLVARLPTMPPAVAAIFTGVVAGLICVGLTWGEVAACEAIRGENSCNDGFGLLAVVVVLAIEIVIGASLLRAFRVSDPFSTSFLGVGLVAMVVMLTFMGDDQMISPLMIAVIPALTAGAFLLSWWVTVRFIEEPSES